MTKYCICHFFSLSGSYDSISLRSHTPIYVYVKRSWNTSTDRSRSVVDCTLERISNARWFCEILTNDDSRYYYYVGIYSRWSALVTQGCTKSIRSFAILRSPWVNYCVNLYKLEFYISKCIHKSFRRGQ